MATCFGWYHKRGNNAKVRTIDMQAGYACGHGRFESHGFFLITREDGAKITIRVPPAEFARLAAQMASLQLAAERQAEEPA